MPSHQVTQMRPAICQFRILKIATLLEIALISSALTTTPNVLSSRHQATISASTRFQGEFANLEDLDVGESDLWQSGLSREAYISSVIWESNAEWKDFVLELLADDPEADPLWEQIRLEATASLTTEPEAGPQLYQSILSQSSLVEAVVTVIAIELETELVQATELRNLFLQTLTKEDVDLIASDVVAAATRSPSIGTALTAIMFQTGLHVLVCYRVGHRLWQAGRKGLAYYLQSSVSRRYSADIHPACKMGRSIYLSTTAGVVIGETAVVGDDVSILQGVTLGGTGKERGDRHPKVGAGVILQDGASVLGNIPVGDGALITAKSIVTKPVPPLAVMAGVPAKIKSYRVLDESTYTDDLSRHLVHKYIEDWKELVPKEDPGLGI